MAKPSYENHSSIADSYSTTAASYAENLTFSDIPHTRLENEMVSHILGSVADQRILDIAGGSGAHARRALAQGAAHVDVVDLSAGMLDAGRQQRSNTEDPDAIGWHQADIYKPLAEQVPDLKIAGYDTVMVIWGFDHASRDSDLEALWGNIATYLKEEGRLVAIRCASPWSESARTGKYGSRFNNVEEIEGGAKFTYTISLGDKEGFTLAASSMEKSYGGGTELAGSFEIRDIQVVDISGLDVVKQDPEFWTMMVNDPHWVGFTGVKRSS